MFDLVQGVVGAWLGQGVNEQKFFFRISFQSFFWIFQFLGYWFFLNFRFSFVVFFFLEILVVKDRCYIMIGSNIKDYGYFLCFCSCFDCQFVFVFGEDFLFILKGRVVFKGLYLFLVVQMFFFFGWGWCLQFFGSQDEEQGWLKIGKVWLFVYLYFFSF